MKRGARISASVHCAAESSPSRLRASQRVQQTACLLAGLYGIPSIVVSVVGKTRTVGPMATRASESKTLATIEARSTPIESARRSSRDPKR